MDSLLNRRDMLKTFAFGLLGTVVAGSARARKRVPASMRHAVFYVGTYTKGTSKGIYRCRLDRVTGSITVERAFPGVSNPSFLAINSARGVLYSVSEVPDFEGGAEGGVVAYAMDQASGDLRLLNSSPSGGTDPCYVALAGDGSFLLVTNYSGGSIAVLSVQADGHLEEVSHVVQHAGSSVTARQQGPHPHSVTLDPSGRFAYVADLGLDRVAIYRFETGRGRLTPAVPEYLQMAGGAGPRHLAFSPDGRMLYVLNELDSTVAALSVNLGTGGLEVRDLRSTLPSGFSGENYPADIHMSPDGRFLYCSNRGHDSIAVFGVNGTSGDLAPLQHESTGGKWPRNFALDPSGQFLLAANQRSDSITVFSVDPGNGTIYPTGSTAVLPTPACVKFV